jgi:hypothetical protein
LADTGLFAAELGTCRMLLCASPQLLRTSPRVAEPDDLLRLPWVSITQLPHPEKLHLVHAESAQRVVLSVHPTVKTHSGIAAREFIRCGGHRPAARLCRRGRSAQRRPRATLAGLAGGLRTTDFGTLSEQGPPAHPRAPADRLPSTSLR